MTRIARGLLLLLATLPTNASAQSLEPQVAESASADAVDVSGLEMLPPDVQADVTRSRSALQIDAALLTTRNSNRYFSAISELYKPDATRPVTVCFFGMVNQLRRRVADAARGWEFPTSSLRFDFGDQPNFRTCAPGGGSDIRIAQQGPGTWSVIGRETDLVRRNDKPTMNLDSATSWLSMLDEKFRRVVQHEFGHAIGLYHEHQNPRGDCIAQLNRKKIVSIFGSAPYNLPEDYLRKNFTANISPDARVAASAFDNRSIMLYYLPPEILTDGQSSPCWHEENMVISPGDQQAIERDFPLNTARSIQRRMQAYAILNTAASDRLIPDAARSDFKLAIGALYPFADAQQRLTYVQSVQEVMSQR